MAGYQSLEKSLAELVGLAGTQSAEASAAQLVAQVRTFIDGGGGGDSGIIVSDSDPGAGNDFWLDTSGLQPVLKIRNAADDGWLVQGGETIEVRTFSFDDPTTIIGAGSCVANFFTLAPNTWLDAVEFVVREAFNDSWFVGDPGTYPTIENPTNDILFFTPPFPVTGGVVLAEAATFPDGVSPSVVGGSSSTPYCPPRLSGPAGAELLLNLNATLVGDGTTGILDVYFHTRMMLTEDNAKLLPDVTDGVATITAPGTLEVGDGLELTEPVAGTAAIAVNKAAFVEPTTATPEAIANALIAAGLMEAS